MWMIYIYSILFYLAFRSTSYLCMSVCHNLTPEDIQLFRWILSKLPCFSGCKGVIWHQRSDPHLAQISVLPLASRELCALIWEVWPLLSYLKCLVFLTRGNYSLWDKWLLPEVLLLLPAWEEMRMWKLQLLQTLLGAGSGKGCLISFQNMKAFKKIPTLP